MNNFDQSNSRLGKLYRNKESAWLAGLCAGLAEKYGLPVAVVRIIAILLLFTPINWIEVMAYLLCWVIVPAKPRDLYRSAEEADFWHRVHYSPSDTFGNLRHRYRDLEHRLQRMEAYLTSKEYELDREINRS